MLEIVATIIKIAIIICATAKKKKYSFENVTSANNIFFMINQYLERDWAIFRLLKSYILAWDLL